MNWNFTRREFLKFCGKLSLVLCGTECLTEDLARAFMKIARKEPPVIWLTGQACSGDSVSLVYTDSPGLVPLLTSLVDLKFHPVLSVAQGEEVLRIIEELKGQGGYILCFEGSIPLKMKGACTIREEYLAEFLKEVVEGALALIACGTCASYGGIPAANPETGAVSLPEYLKKLRIEKPVVRIPGCPMNGVRFTGTVAYFVAYGRLPKLDRDGRPVMYYGEVVHSNCQRFQWFNQDRYVMDYARDKRQCLFRMGCRGPVTYADCPLRRWNRNTSWCVDANTPCVGCAHPSWPWPREEGIYTDPQKIRPEALIGGGDGSQVES